MIGHCFVHSLFKQFSWCHVNLGGGGQDIGVMFEFLFASAVSARLTLEKVCLTLCVVHKSVLVQAVTVQPWRRVGWCSVVAHSLYVCP